VGLIRLFLACGVAFGHITAMVTNHLGLITDPAWVLNVAGCRPVLLFYVVSGFLISFVLDKKYDAGANGTLRFYRSRFLRIYPLWWVVLALSMVLTGQRLTPGNFAVATTLFGSDWMVSFAKYPEGYTGMFPSELGIAWTLAAELTFYAIAPFVLRSTMLALTLFGISAMVRVTVLYLVPQISPMHLLWSYFFFPATLAFFLLGHFARQVCERFPIGTVASIALLVVAGVLSWSELSMSVEGLPSHAAVVCFALALPGIFQATKEHRIQGFLGDLTYPLYLTHTLTITLLFSLPHTDKLGAWLVRSAKPLGSPLMQGGYLLGAVLAIAIAVATIVHIVIEIPARSVVARLLSVSIAYGNILMRHLRLSGTKSAIVQR